MAAAVFVQRSASLLQSGKCQTMSQVTWSTECRKRTRACTHTDVRARTKYVCQSVCLHESVDNRVRSGCMLRVCVQGRLIVRVAVYLLVVCPSVCPFVPLCTPRFGKSSACLTSTQDCSVCLSICSTLPSAVWQVVRSSDKHARFMSPTTWRIHPYSNNQEGGK